MTTPGTSLPWQLVDARIAADPARPLLTAYTDPPGAPDDADRTDLTGATWATWVAKTANLLVDDLGLAVDEADPPVVACVLPPHWQTAVWADAVNRVGAVLLPRLPDGGPAPAVVVTTPDGAAAALASGAGDVLVAPLLPMNAPAREPLPAGVLDYAAEVSAHGDRFVPPVRSPRPDDEALLAAATTLVDAAGLVRGDRLLSTGVLPGSPHVELLAVAVVDGSLVLSPDARTLDPVERRARWDAERVTRAVPADRDLLS